MRIAILIEIIEGGYENNTYNTIDRFVELNEDNTLEMQIMKKYPNLGSIIHCDDKFIYDKVNRKSYLIVSV